MGMRQGSLTVTAILALCALPGGLAAQNRMEGVVTFRMEDSQGKIDTVTQTTRGHSVRLEGYGKKGSAWIYDGDEKRMVMLDATQKQAMVISQQDADQAQAMMQGMRQARGAKPDAE